MREDTQKLLAEYKVKTLGNKKNIEILDGRIATEETVLYIAPTNMKFKININSVKSSGAGVIAFTEQHIYIYNTITPSKEFKISLQELVNVDFNANGKSGTTFTLLFMDAAIIEFAAGYKKDLTVKLFNTIQNLITRNAELRPVLQETPTAVQAAPPQSQPDTADELRKFKQLLDDDIITQGDFDKKKKQLLGL